MSGSDDGARHRARAVAEVLRFNHQCPLARRTRRSACMPPDARPRPLAPMMMRRFFSKIFCRMTKVCDAGLVFDSDEHHAFRAAGSLTDRDDAGGLNPSLVFVRHGHSAGDDAAFGKIRPENGQHLQSHIQETNGSFAPPLQPLRCSDRLPGSGRPGCDPPKPQEWRRASSQLANSELTRSTF